jgi:hypothetical protein
MASPLIKIAAPKTGLAEGMDPAIEFMRPGGTPPLIVPHCRKCGIPVERFTIDPISSPFYMMLDARCHGAQQGIKISSDEVFGRKKTGQPLWMF